MEPLRIGVLAVQGNFREHAQMLRRLGADDGRGAQAVELDGLDGLVIPGGESTDLHAADGLYGLDEAFARFERPVFGTCAGMIVLDRDHLGLVDVTVRRNAFGRQVASFETDLEVAGETRRCGPSSSGRRGSRRSVPDVEVLAEVDGRPVLAREGRFLVAAFHPELTDDTRLHRAVPGSRRGGACLSGHSKWSSIKHKKGAADAKRGQLFSKLSRAIIVAAKEGGGDPANNLSLQNAIEKAKSYSMPKDNIDRAIAKGSGADADDDAFESIVYEGYGPEGVAVIVEALTDNRNRTAADIRHLFAKNGGNLGTTGAVAWQFERRGVVVVPADGVDEEELFLAAADGGAETSRRTATSSRSPRAPESLAAVREAMSRPASRSSSAELHARPEDTVAVEDEVKARQVMRLIEALEENDDVQDVYANFDIPERVLEAVAG